MWSMSTCVRAKAWKTLPARSDAANGRPHVLEWRILPQVTAIAEIRGGASSREGPREREMRLRSRWQPKEPRGWGRINIMNCGYYSLSKARYLNIPKPSMAVAVL